MVLLSCTKSMSALQSGFANGAAVDYFTLSIDYCRACVILSCAFACVILSCAFAGGAELQAAAWKLVSRQQLAWVCLAGVVWCGMVWCDPTCSGWWWWCGG